MDDFFTIDQPTPPSSSNGLPAQAWVAVGAIDPRLTEPLLESLRSAGVGAYVAPFTSRRSSTRLEMRLWVDAALKPEAERVVATVLPELRASLHESEDERWSQLVASLQSDADDDGDTPWPAAEGYASIDSSTPPTPAYSAPEEPPPVFDDPEDHYVPPDPPPLPPANPVTKYGWVALLGGIVLLVVPALVGHAIGNGLLALAIAAIVGGFVTLVLRMKDGPPTDSGPDDGAVI
jgi:hypothetical protein